MDKTEIGLVIILSALTNDRSLFRQAIAELGSSQSQDASLKVLKTAKSLLSDKQRQWIEGQMWKMWIDPEGKNKYLPYSAYSNRTIGDVPLTHSVHARLTEAEHQRIKEIAASVGQTRSQWLRDVLTRELQSAG